MDENLPRHDSNLCMSMWSCKFDIKIVNERSIRCYIFLQGRIVGVNDEDNQSNTVTWSEWTFDRGWLTCTWSSYYTMYITMCHAVVWNLIENYFVNGVALMVMLGTVLKRMIVLHVELGLKICHKDQLHIVDKLSNDCIPTLTSHFIMALMSILLLYIFVVHSD